MYIVSLKNGSSTTVVHEYWPSDVKLDSAQISKEVNAFDSFTFDIYPENPGWGQINAFTTTVEVVNSKTGKVVFDGRVISPVPSMDSDGVICLSVTCEGLMGYLRDSQQPYLASQHYDDSDGTTGLQKYIQKLLDVHNSKVEAYKQIRMGEVTLQTFDTSNGVTKSISRESTWDNIKEKLLDVFGGEMQVRRGTDGLLYLDYKERLGTTRATAIELGRNMQDVESSPDPSAVVTRLYPYGAKITTEEAGEDGTTQEVETEERIDITSVNGGVPYIDDEVGMQLYGIIEGVMEWDDVTQPSNLLAKARDWLGDNNVIPVSTTVSALDLSLIGLDYDAFELFDSYPVRNELIGLDDTVEIVKQTIDVNDPSASSFDLGDTSMRLSVDIAGTGDLQQQVIQFQNTVNTTITNIQNSVRATQASIEVMENRITQNVTETVSTTIIEEITPGIKEQVSQQVGQETSELQQQIQQAQQAAQSAQSAANNAAEQAAQAAGIAAGKGNVVIQDSQPDAGLQSSTTLWIDTTGGANTPKRWNGTSWVAVTDKQATDAAAAAAAAAQQAEESGDYLLGLIDDYKQQTDTAINDANDAIKDAQTAIDGVLAIITENVTKLTELTQTVDGWDFNWQTISETITSIDGVVSTEIEERNKYIRFIDGEIWLGRDAEEGEDEFKVVISNTRIRFLQNNIEVAYISNKKLYITDAEVTNRMTLGSFAFYPRSNGNLTLRHNA